MKLIRVKKGTHHWLMVGKECLFHKRELLRTQGMEDLNELRELGEKKKRALVNHCYPVWWNLPLDPRPQVTDFSELSCSSSPCLQDKNPILWPEVHPLNHLVASTLHFFQAIEFSSITFNEHLLHTQHFTQAQSADIHATIPACKAFFSREVGLCNSLWCRLWIQILHHFLNV